MSNCSSLKKYKNKGQKSTKNNLDSLIYENKKNIDMCVLERIKNDKDIDSINVAIKYNQKLIKELLLRLETLETKEPSETQVKQIEPEVKEPSKAQAKQIEPEAEVKEPSKEEEETIKEEEETIKKEEETIKEEK